MAETYVRERSGDGRKDRTYPAAPKPLAVPVYDNHAHLEITDGPSTGSGTQASTGSGTQASTGSGTQASTGSGTQASAGSGTQGLSLVEQLDRAEAVGVIGVVQASGDIESSRWAVEAAASDPRVLAAVAIHPNDAPTYAEEGRLDEAIAVIDELAAHPRTRAIGETGLDFFRTEPERRGPQFASFEAHITLAKKHGIAMQIHDRDAHEAVLETLTRVGAPERTVFHCFSGDEAMARVCADAGYYLSFAGNVTFKNAQNLRDALKVAPLDRLLVETDAPFLTPVPLRGRPNAPYLVPLTVRFLAAELALDVDELSAQLAENTLRVYGSFAG